VTGRLAGRVALVTGAGQGIGRAIARRLADEAAIVGVNDLAGDRAEQTVRQIVDGGGVAVSLPGDVCEPDDVHRLTAELADTAGGLDILVNNAGIFPWREDWTAIDLAEWDRVMAVNVRSAYVCARAAHPYLRRGGHGRIINISSTVWMSGAKSMLHYVTSKAALIGFTRALASEVGDDGITVNAIATGRTITEGLRGWIDAGHMTIDGIHASRQSQAIKRVGEPAEIAAAVAFLASDDASYLTAHTLVVDGGRNPS
jgi:NAD(P)-dependent dehydrogenase (short-subunit alcohol dehydrogenase family)